MIVYALRCSESHEFEAWFRSGDTFEAQAAAGEIACPFCGGTRVGRALMAPNIARGRTAELAVQQSRDEAVRPSAPADAALHGQALRDRPAAGQAVAGPPGIRPPDQMQPAPRQAGGGHLPPERALIEAVHRLRAHVEAHCRNVGDGFAAEARRMHRGEIEAEAIYGRASRDEAEALQDEGIPVLPLPWPTRTDS